MLRIKLPRRGAGTALCHFLCLVKLAKKALLSLWFSLLVFGGFAQTKQKPVEMLLLGTFHFNNPGPDAAKVETFNVLTPQVPAEPEKITDEISLLGE